MRLHNFTLELSRQLFGLFVSLQRDLLELILTSSQLIQLLEQSTNPDRRKEADNSSWSLYH